MTDSRSLPTAEEVAAAHGGLKRSGAEWIGPCPNCGGDDRFAVKDRGDRTALVNCRGCGDFGAIMKALFPDRCPARPSRPRLPPPETVKTMEEVAARARWHLADLERESRARDYAHLERLNRLADPAGAVEPRILGPDGEPATAPGPPLLSIAELRALPTVEHEWIVDDLLPAAGMSMLDADPKAGKTTLLATLAVAVAHGDRFLGRPTTEGPVLTLTFEEREDAHLARLDKLGVSDDSPIYSLCGFLPGDLDRLEWVRSQVARHGPRLIIVDTLPRLVELPEVNEYGAVTAALEPWIALARSSGAHLLFAVHARKSGGEFGKSILGSAALAAAPDVLLSIKRDESDGVRRLSSEARYGTALEPTELVLDPETGRVELGATRADERQQGLLRIRRELLATVDEATEPLKREHLVSKTEGRSADVRKMLDQLVGAGEIIESKARQARVYTTPL